MKYVDPNEKVNRHIFLKIFLTVAVVGICVFFYHNDFSTITDWFSVNILGEEPYVEPTPTPTPAPETCVSTMERDGIDLIAARNDTTSAYVRQNLQIYYYGYNGIMIGDNDCFADAFFFEDIIYDTYDRAEHLWTSNYCEGTAFDIYSKTQQLKTEEYEGHYVILRDLEVDRYIIKYWANGTLGASFASVQSKDPVIGLQFLEELYSSHTDLFKLCGSTSKHTEEELILNVKQLLAKQGASSEIFFFEGSGYDVNMNSYSIKRIDPEALYKKICDAYDGYHYVIREQGEYSVGDIEGKYVIAFLESNCRFFLRYVATKNGKKVIFWDQNGYDPEWMKKVMMAYFESYSD